jgi:hypothetical protein
MHIENHQYRATIKALTEADLHELVEILEIPRHHWKEKASFKTGELYALQYAYGTAKESAYIKLGSLADTYIHQAKRDTWADLQDVPSGYEPYYKEVNLLLHGSFFDHSDFDFSRLLQFLERVGNKQG